MPETHNALLTRVAEELAAISQRGIQAHATEYDENVLAEG